MHRALPLAALAAGTASAQTPSYPAQPIRVVVGFAASGPTVLVGRALPDRRARNLNLKVE